MAVIVSKDGFLVNFDHVTTVFQHEDTFVDTQTNSEVKGFAIMAYIRGEEEPTILGVYDDGVKMEQAMAKLTDWLQNDFGTGKLFRMPE